MNRDDWLQQMNDESRERLLYAALDECHRKGVSKEAMLTIMFETGTRYMPEDQERQANG